MYQLKPLSKGGVAAALKKAERYRLLNEAWEAESICQDVLEVEPDNEQALVMLILALTDQFGRETGGTVATVQALLPRLAGEYERAYYAGIICERWAKLLLERAAPGTGGMIYDWLRQAMEWYERAEGLRPPGEDDAILRWNTCARVIQRHEHVRPAVAEARAAIESE